MERYVCIHGHFYQPPRENPWLEAIELQESAYPFHDWNDRIADECYAANARSRILDGRGEDGRILDIVNNYEWISFNFGPTLLSWLQDKRPDVYAAIIEADRRSAERYGGHGNAIAQGYGHIILPLSNDRDRRTQVLWGIRDFQHRFGREPEGMWLPETAANTASLEALAEQGIRFTILAPRQARRVRKLGPPSRHWTELKEGRGIDPSRAYLCRLPSGRHITLFFYDGPVSQGVAFERLLESGEKFAARLGSIFDDNRDWPQLAHIATDGETYGHHHRHGDMALAYALHHIETEGLARLTNYAQFMELHPPTHEVQIHDDSSWSCVHGVERWKSDCGCNTGRAEWHQKWRAPLREALDWLRDSVAPRYEAAAAELLRHPWAARDDYISVVLDRSEESVSAYFGRNQARPLSDQERTRALKLLELQRHAMLMYTSCGWFFDELSGIETTQVMQYAGRVIQLAHETFGDHFEEGFVERLEKAPSNLPERPSGRVIYTDFVKPAFVDLHKVGAHYAVSSLFEAYPDTTDIYAYAAERQHLELITSGRSRLLVGRARFRSRITGESDELSFGVFHFGDHILNAGVRSFQGDEAYGRLLASASEAFRNAEFPQLLAIMGDAFGSANYSLRDLFKDEQRKVLDAILESTLLEIQSAYRHVYETHAPLLRFLATIHVAPPATLRHNAELVLNAEIRSALLPDPPDLDRVLMLRREAQEQSITFDAVTLGFVLKSALDRAADHVLEEPRSLERINQLAALAALANEMPFEVSLWKAQNVYFELRRGLLPRVQAENDPRDSGWIEAFLELGRRLHFKVD